jgi:putative spermidine/putrescine transport system permease protein
VGPGLDGDQGLSHSGSFLHRRPRLQLALLLSGPVGWLVVAYLGSLAVLFVAAFWHLDSFTSAIVKDYSLQNFETLVQSDVYRQIALRTVAIAAAVTVTDALLAFPIAFYMAKVASRRTRALLAVAVLMPLWASYLVKVYAWRTILSEEGILNWALSPLGLNGPGFGNVATWLVFSYLWLPYMILPVYAGMERIPDSLLDAAGDLGARPGRTFRHVVLPRRCRPSWRARSSHSRSRWATTSRRSSSRTRSSSATSSTPTSASPTTCRWRPRSRPCRWRS